MFNHIRELMLDPELEERIAHLSPSINDPSTSSRRADYRVGKFETGRLYASGFQSIKGSVKRLCSYTRYMDIDIKNCGPVLFMQLLMKNDIVVPPLLNLYATN